MSPKQKDNKNQIALNFPTQYSIPLQFFLRKCHNRGSWISPCLEDPITPSAIFQHRRLPNGCSLATIPDIFEVADNVKKRADPPQHQTVKKSAIVPQKVHPDRTKPLPSVQTNFIEDDEGNYSTSFQYKVHVYPSGPRIITPEVPVPPTMVHTAQPPRVDTEGPSSNLRSRGKKTPIPIFYW